MNLRSDEMLVWKAPSHMIMKGQVVEGEFFMTNKRAVFMTGSPSNSPRAFRKLEDFWELNLGKIMEMNLHDVKGIPVPLIRLRYSENEVFFTFPGMNPTSTLAAIRIFVNKSRNIEKEMEIIKGIERALTENTVSGNTEVPKMIRDLTLPADKMCFQCGKSMDEAGSLSEDDYPRCPTCLPAEHVGMESGN